MAKKFKFSLIDLIKLTKSRKNYFLMIVFVIFSNSLFANGAVGYKGVYINSKGTKTWYKAHNVSWSYNGCGNYQFNSASDFSGQNFGTFTSTEELKIAGFAVVGWTDGSDWVAGKLLYKVWEQGDSEPGSWSEIYIGNYGNGNGATQVVCQNSNDRVVGYDNGTTNINPGAPGTYNFKIQALGRMQWSGGFFNVNDGPEVTATFTITSSTTDQFRSKATGNWNTSGSWESSSNGTNWATSTLVPGADASAITIQSGHTITLDANVSVKLLTVNSGATFTASDASPRTLTIAKSASGSSTTLANNGTWANGTGGSTVVFSGAPSSGDAIHAITGTIAFQNITINKTGGSSNVGASFGANSSVSGTLEIGAGGFVSTAPPTGFYGSNAILKFNQGTGANYNVGASDYTWSTTVIPNYITISSGTVNLNSPRTASGNLLIDGGALVLNAGLTIQGNWTRSSGTFTPNLQTVTLSGATNSIINTATDATLYDMVVSKTGGAYVTLDNNLTVSHNLSISTGAILNVPSGKGLTVNGTLINSAGVTGFVIKSDASGTGSLIHSTSGVNATVERYISGGWGSADAGWHQISSPVASQAISSFETTGAGNGYDFYGWDELTNMWMNYKDGGFSAWNSGTNFNVGQGYLISYETTQTGKSFTGALNTADVTKTNLTRTGPSISAGFHLLGNPFASAIKWNDGNWALTDVAGTAKIWNEGNKSYSDIAANGYIPSAQGFMVQVADATNSITIPLASRVHNSTNWYKSGNQTEKFFLIAAEQSGLSAQESQILVNPDATPEYDFYFDSHFLAGYAPQFYSIAGDIKLSTNTLPSLPDDAIIPFGFVKNEATQFNITMQEQISGYIVYLNDLLTGVEHNLTDQPVYSFSSAEGDDPNRFLLYFAPVSVNKPSQGNAYGIYSYAGQVYISNTPSNAQITLSTLTGQVVMQRNAGGSGLVTLNAASLPKGVYIVTVQGEGARVSRKVVL